ncbi:hypothetical protein [Pectobacterium sp. IFB5596]|uniref:hypothetical protein n=1 Tax=Pectobacterium sp. IFB5596 TaxID=1839803 RepID=UPI001F43051B|nr:hypothetical protein [Pectobacterium sp. IFB5596]
MSFLFLPNFLIDQQKGVSSVGSVGSRASKPRQHWIYVNQHTPYYVGSAVIFVGSPIQPENDWIHRRVGSNCPFVGSVLVQNRKYFPYKTKNLTD